MSDSLLQIELVTPDRIVFSGTAREVTLQTIAGEITVLPRHIPLISGLATGVITLRTPGEPDQVFAVSTGVVEVRPQSKVIIMADTGELASEIDIERAEAAVARAESIVASGTVMDDLEYERLKAHLHKNLARVKIAQKYRP